MRVTRFAVDEDGRALYPDYFVVDEARRIAIAFYSANIDTQEIVNEGMAFTPWLSQLWRGRAVRFDEWRNAILKGHHAFPQHHAQIAERADWANKRTVNEAFAELFMSAARGERGESQNEQEREATRRLLLTETNVDFVDFLQQ